LLDTPELFGFNVGKLDIEADNGFDVGSSDVLLERLEGSNDVKVTGLIVGTATMLEGLREGESVGKKEGD
jgi:hypothetical protein